MKRIIALILVAIVLSTATGVASYVYLQNAEQHVLAGLDTVVVLESKGTIPAGTKYSDAVNAGLIEPVDVPSKFSSSSMLTPNVTVSGGYVAGRDISPGRLLFQGDFVATVETARVLPVPSDEVAMSFPLDAANRLAPFLAPGDHVAILSGGGTTARVVFSDVLVLGVGNNTKYGAGTGEGAEGLITVAIPISQSADLLAAIKSGSLYLAMLHSQTA